jgi:hypothetical protein
MPTTNLLTRILMVQSQYGRGSIFSIVRVSDGTLTSRWNVEKAIKEQL